MIKQTFEWDYAQKDWSERAKDNPHWTYAQKDWNQTLVTRVNLASAHCNKDTGEDFSGDDMTGGGNLLRVWPSLIEIFKTLEYFDITNSVLSGRYKVMLDTSVSPYTIVLSNNNFPYEYIIEVKNYCPDTEDIFIPANVNNLDSMTDAVDIINRVKLIEESKIQPNYNIIDDNKHKRRP